MILLISMDSFTYLPAYTPQPDLLDSLRLVIAGDDEFPLHFIICQTIDFTLGFNLKR